MQRGGSNAEPKTLSLNDAWKYESGRRLLPYDLFKWWGRRPALAIAMLLLESAGIIGYQVADIVASRLAHRSSKILSNLKICDPMCGGGTTLFEALFLGAGEVLCSDVNFASTTVVKATIKVLKECDDVVSIILKALRRVSKELEDMWCVNGYCYVHSFLTKECSGEYCIAPRWVGIFRVKGDILKIAITETGELVEDQNVGIRDTVKLPRERLVEVSNGVYAYVVEMYNAGDPLERGFISLIKDRSVAAHLEEAQRIAKSRLSEECTPITSGRETRRLLGEGIKCWEQIFTPRQLLTLKLLTEYMVEENRDMVEVAVATVGTIIRTASLLAFYYQPYGKVNPGLVVKSFWIPRYPVELNPIAGDLDNVKTVGRGTIITYVRKLKKTCKTVPNSIIVQSSDNVAITMMDAFDVDYRGCDVVILDPPYPGKVTYEDLTQVYAIPYSFLNVDLPIVPTKAIDTGNLEKYVETIANLVLKILNQAPKAQIYMMLGFDKKGEIAYEDLKNMLSQQGVSIELKDSIVAEAPGTLGRSKARKVMIIKMVKLAPENHYEPL
jgi:16S rRNA G966 N2-methylase RsmD